jgi:hypothetical protein
MTETLVEAAYVSADVPPGGLPGSLPHWKAHLPSVVRSPSR